MLKEWLAVALGGMLGTLARHALSGVFSLISPSWLPIATLSANVVGCFAIGVLAQWTIQQQFVGQWWVVGIRVGFLGGLTTFSSFGLEVIRMWQTERAIHSIAFVTSHLVVGLAAVALGMSLAKATAGELPLAEG